MQEDAAAHALGCKALVTIEVALVAEGEEGTGGRFRDLDFEPVALGLGCSPAAGARPIRAMCATPSSRSRVASVSRPATIGTALFQ